MGWGTGSRIAEELWKDMLPVISKSNYKRASKLIMDKFREYDADDWELYPSVECLYYVYLKENEPAEFEELREEMELDYD